MDNQVTQENELRSHEAYGLPGINEHFGMEKRLTPSKAAEMLRDHGIPSDEHKSGKQRAANRNRAHKKRFKEALLRGERLFLCASAATYHTADILEQNAKNCLPKSHVALKV